MFEQLSELVSHGVPCFFYSNFDGTQFHCYSLNELQTHDIEFSFNQPVHLKNYPHKPKYTPVDYSAYNKKFKKVHEHLRAGNTYLLNLTQPSKIITTYTIKEIYEMSYAPYKFRIEDQFVSFSPEPFITIENDAIHTYPMKGTIDASIPNAVQKILKDPKELAEHTMIVDLLRNDLGIIANDIKVNCFRYISTIDTGTKTLHQVSSHISGKLDKTWKETIGQSLKKLLPAGSISGTPKSKTVELIKEIEGYDRGYFSGIFGHFDGENFYSAVSIRFIENTPEGLVYKSGGGITADSICEKEYQEMIDKIYIP